MTESKNITTSILSYILQRMGNNHERPMYNKYEYYVLKWLMYKNENGCSDHVIGYRTRTPNSADIISVVNRISLTTHKEYTAYHKQKNC